MATNDQTVSQTNRVGVVSRSLLESEKLAKQVMKHIESHIAVEIMTWAWNGSFESGSSGSEQKHKGKNISELTSEGFSELGHLVIVDEKVKDLRSFLEMLPREGKVVFLVTENADQVPDVLKEGLVDDVIVSPFRKIEVLTKFKFYHQFLDWAEVKKMNQSFSRLVENFHDDLQVAELIQKNNLPTRFEKVRGFNVTSRYLAGMKPGGDFFDLAEYEGGFHLLMSDSSSYGLSSAVIHMMMKVASKLTREESRSGSEIFKRLQEEIKSVLKFQDHLSLLFGSYSNKNGIFRYFSLGKIKIYYSTSSGEFQCLDNHGPVITSKESIFRGTEKEIVLEPGSRLVVVSDGFVEVAERSHGEEGLVSLLNEKRSLDPKDSINELVFQIKKGFSQEFDVAPQDCSMLVFDADPKALKLVS